MAKQKFYKLEKDPQTGGNKWVEDKGDRIRHFGEDFFVHHRWNPHYDHEKEWVITHGRTGLIVIHSGTTKQSLIERFEWYMEHIGEEKFRTTVEKYLQQYGLSPLYSEDKKKATAKKKTTTKKKATTKKAE